MKDEATSLGYELESDISYVEGSQNPRQRLDIYRPLSCADEKLPVVIYFHGGGWEAGDKEGGFRRIKEMLDTGYIFVSVAYRLSGDAPWPAMMDDCVSALEYVKREIKGVDSARIALWGSSAGAHLACLLAGGCRATEEPAVRCVVNFCAPVTVDSFVNSLVGEEREVSQVMKLLGGDHEQTSHFAKESTVTNWVQSGFPTTLIVHGDDDQVVPLLQSQILAEKIKSVSSSVELYIAENSPHRVDSDAVTAKVRQFLLENLSV